METRQASRWVANFGAAEAHSLSRQLLNCALMTFA
jgi:hypothetical protein